MIATLPVVGSSASDPTSVAPLSPNAAAHWTDPASAPASGGGGRAHPASTSVKLLSVVLEDVADVSDVEVVEVGVVMLSEDDGEVSDDVLEFGVLSEVEISLLEGEEGEVEEVEVEELEGEVEEENGEVELPELEVEGPEPDVLEDPCEDEEVETGDEPVVTEEVAVPEVVELPDMTDDPPPSGHWHGPYPSPLPAHT